MGPHSQRVPLETTSPEAPPSPAVPEPSPIPSGPELTPEQVQAVHDQIVAALQTCYDPEIPVNIHELGLIYGIEVTPDGAVQVRMTLTTPMCPAAGSLPPEVRAKALAVPGVRTAQVDLVWDPPWGPERMSEAARLQLGLF